MPFIILALGILAVGAIFLIPRTAQGFVGGKPVTLQVASIGDFNDVLRIDAANAWNRMKADADAEGVTLQPKGPNSAFRTHDQQVEMLQQRPGFAAQVDHSPHQAGIAVDVDLTDGATLPWLQENGPDYGWFPLGPAGAAKEPWHWEYHGSAQT